MSFRIPSVSVSFSCQDPALQRLYDDAEQVISNNTRMFGSDPVLVEGAGYEKIWLETQPMGGEMAFFRCPEAAVNNTLLFMRTQREDGRLPGSIALTGNSVTPQFDKLQGFCFARPALDLYYLTGRDAEYLQLLRSCLSRFDSWLHKTRDLDGTGILSSFCVYDTGEDNALRYGDAPCYAREDEPIQGNRFVPLRSMDVTSYSYSCREMLEKVCALLGLEQESLHWHSLACETASALRAHLWDDARSALFDVYPGREKCNVLCHNTLRCMHWHSLAPADAAAFVNRHLLNENEFFTPVPLPSVSVSDPLFADREENNWSGQPEGLTFQRAVDALENYGFDALVPVFGRRLIETVMRNGNRFTQQYSPFTGASSSEKNGYGPTALSVLEYMSRMHGVDIEQGRVRFSDVGGVPFRYALTLDDAVYSLESDGVRACLTACGRETVFPSGSQLITDLSGNVLRTVSLSCSLVPPPFRKAAV